MEEVPALQLVQVVLAAADHRPALQFRQLSVDEAAIMLEKVPALQFVHAALPAKDQVPALQFVQTVLAIVDQVPALHA